ncbi:uncharacterized protein LOC131937889 isoform X2 [Physella acuta]|nr:uncharacterized protein LOC131937889 isoform X2 [Physella acuta]
MLELMTWTEIIEDLKVEGNFKMAAIFDLTGTKIAETSGAALTEEDAVGVMKALDAAASMLYGLFLLGSKFSCINVDPSTVIGQANGHVFVANRNQNLLVCAVSDAPSRTSCLGTVRNFISRLGTQGAPEALVPSLM